MTSEGGRVEQARYAAFLSYSHRDRRWATWIHRALESYLVPRHLRRAAAATGEVPRRLRPVFRDRDELPASADLGERIEAALDGSRALIVLCSPDASRSRWTNEEIATFKRTHPERPILAAIVAGEPHASEVPGREHEEAFPPALRVRFSADGAPTAARAEPIAADLRRNGDGRRLGKLKLVAGILGVGLDELVRRDAARRNRRLAWLASGAVAGMTLTTALAVYAFDQRAEAVRQREQAESLVEFMLTDLRAKLEPVGRLDVLGSVGDRAMAYYATTDPRAQSAESLGRRARALHLIGEVANLRGDLDRALADFGDAARSTAELLKRSPDDPQRIYNHAQSEYWVGYVAWQHGRLDAAERAFTSYLTLARRLVAERPADRAYRLEVSYALGNLGTVLMDRGRPREAEQRFVESYRIVSALPASTPVAADQPLEIAEARAWLADARERQGKFAQALDDRRAEVAIYTRMLAREPSDQQAQVRLAQADRATGRLLFALGERGASVAALTDANRRFARALALEPANTLSIESAVAALEDAAEVLIAQRRAGEAAALLTAAEAHIADLLRRDRTVVAWRGLLVSRALSGRALLAREREPRVAAGLATRAARTLDTPSAAPSDLQVARARAAAWLVAGDAYAAAGDAARARGAWGAVLAGGGAGEPRVDELRALAAARLRAGAEPAARIDPIAVALRRER